MSSTTKKSGKASGARGKVETNGKDYGDEGFELSSEAKAFIEESSAEHGVSFKDRLLIAIKDGEKHTSDDLLKHLKDQVPVGLLVPDATAPDAKPPKAGLRALLADAVVSLREANRIKVKGYDDADGYKLLVQLVPPEPDKRFKLDPEFRGLLPPQQPSEVAELERQLLTEGCRDPLAVWKDGDKTYLVDGHTRLEICLRHGLDYKLTTFDLPSRQAVIDWMWDYHYGRRNFTSQAESYRRGLRFNATRLAHGGDRKSTSQNATMKRAAKALAATYNVNRATLFRDGDYAAGVDEIVGAVGERGDEFRRKLLAGAIPLPRRKVLALSEKTKTELVPLVKKLLEGEKVKLGTNRGRKVVSLALGRNKADEQARTLLDALGPKHAATLVEELNKLLKEANNKADGAKRGTEDTP